MKNSGNGRAKILSPSELNRLFERGFTSSRDKLLFAIAYYCACRISEALALKTDDLMGGVVTLRKATTFMQVGHSHCSNSPQDHRISSGL